MINIPTSEMKAKYIFENSFLFFYSLSLLAFLH